jgi:hypothetical protein
MRYSHAVQQISTSAGDLCRINCRLKIVANRIHAVSASYRQVWHPTSPRIQRDLNKKVQTVKRLHALTVVVFKRRALGANAVTPRLIEDDDFPHKFLRVHCQAPDWQERGTTSAFAAL